MKEWNSVWKWAIGIIVVAVISFILLLVFKGNGTLPSFVPKGPLNNEVNLNIVLSDLEDKIRGEQPEQEIEEPNPDEENFIENPEDEEPEEVLDESILDFNEYSYLERKALVLTKDSQVNEVWLVKLTDYNEQEAVARILGNRIRKLKNAFQENPEQLKIIEDAVVKQEEGIMIAIISPHSRNIEKALASEI